MLKENDPKIAIPHDPESFKKQRELYVTGKHDQIDAYARYGYKEQREWESKLAEEIGVPDAAVTNSGMAAIHTAIEAEHIKTGDTVLCSKEVYDCTLELFEYLKKRGVRVEIIDPTDTEKIAELTEQTKPSLIIMESVANTKEMRLADIDKTLEITEAANKKYQDLTPEDLLEKRLKGEYQNLKPETKQEILRSIETFKETNNSFCFREAVRRMVDDLSGQDKNNDISRSTVISDLKRMATYIDNNHKDKLNLIIDNTLPSVKKYNPLNELNDDMLTDMVVVESGTKHYQLDENKVTLGISYSNNAEKVKEIKKVRTNIGTYLQPGSLKEIPENSLKLMQSKMDRHMSNAKLLAERLEGLKKVKSVFHPNLASHPDKERADNISSDGLVSMFYIDIETDVDPDKFVEELHKKAGGRIKIGGSFGHPDTWILPMENTIRIAVGSEDEKDFRKVAKIFKDVLE